MQLIILEASRQKVNIVLNFENESTWKYIYI
jgi:hypothetical protein